jgi:hypothetical protein
MFKQPDDHKWRCYDCNKEFIGGELWIDGLKGVCKSCYVKKHGDKINSPKHYTHGGIETIDYLQAKLTQEQFEGYLIGNILKYISRYPHKNGAEDLRKAQWYLDRLIKSMEG